MNLMKSCLFNALVRSFNAEVQAATTLKSPYCSRVRLAVPVFVAEGDPERLPVSVDALAAVLDAAAVDDDCFDKLDLEELRWEFGARVRALLKHAHDYEVGGELVQLDQAKNSAAAVGAVALLMLQAFDDEAEALRVLDHGGITAQEVQS